MLRSKISLEGGRSHHVSVKRGLVTSFEGAVDNIGTPSKQEEGNEEEKTEERSDAFQTGPKNQTKKKSRKK